MVLHMRSTSRELCLSNPCPQIPPGCLGRRISAYAIGAYRTIPGTRSKSESLLARLVSLW